MQIRFSNGVIVALIPLVVIAGAGEIAVAAGWVKDPATVRTLTAIAGAIAGLLVGYFQSKTGKELPNPIGPLLDRLWKSLQVFLKWRMTLWFHIPWLLVTIIGTAYSAGLNRWVMAMCGLYEFVLLVQRLRAGPKPVEKQTS